MARYIVSMGVALLLASGSLCQAQQVTLLTEKYVKKLSPKATPAYNQGVDAFDHINYDLALEHFAKAMKLDPQHIKLRFLVARFAHLRGKMKSGKESMDLFAIAQEALEGILQIKGLKAEDRRRAEMALAEVKKDDKDVIHRDSKREVAGKKLIEAIVAEREKGVKLPALGLGGPKNGKSSLDEEGSGGGRGEGGGGQGGGGQGSGGQGGGGGGNDRGSTKRL